MVASPPPAVTAVRVVSVCAVVAVLTGCAGSASRQGMEPPENYFSMALPGLAEGENLAMSRSVTPLANCVAFRRRHLRSFVRHC